MQQNARFIRKLPIPMDIKKEFPCRSASLQPVRPALRKCAPFWMGGIPG